MRRLKKVLLLFIGIFMMMGVGGCMNHNEDIVDDLIKYAEDKYGRSFTLISSYGAVDATRKDVVALRDEAGCVFNVYKYAEGEDVFDDYIESIIDKKFYDDIKQRMIQDEVDFGVMVTMCPNYDLGIIEGMNLSECISKYGLSSIVFVLKLNGEDGTIIKNYDYIESIYKCLQTYNSEIIVFNVIITNHEDKSIDQTLQNMRDRYNANWYKYESVCEYIFKVNPEIVNLDSLVSMIEDN